jgi:adenylate cyclase class IV
VLTQALGARGQVKKRRLLFMYQQTRIHVDKVEGLGNFMELEVGNITEIFLAKSD